MVVYSFSRRGETPGCIRLVVNVATGGGSITTGGNSVADVLPVTGEVGRVALALRALLGDVDDGVKMDICGDWNLRVAVAC